MGTSTISMAIFNCYVSSPEGIFGKIICECGIFMYFPLPHLIRYTVKVAETEEKARLQVSVRLPVDGSCAGRMLTPDEFLFWGTIPRSRSSLFAVPSPNQSTTKSTTPRLTGKKTT